MGGDVQVMATGFDATRKLAELEGKVPNPKRPTWMHFRELWEPRWSDAFRHEVKSATGSDRFKYSVAVTRLKGNASGWETHPRIQRNLGGNPFSFLTLEEMWTTLVLETTTTPASSDIGRLAQLLKAAGLQAT
jgi:hypothetical protein